MASAGGPQYGNGGPEPGKAPDRGPAREAPRLTLNAAVRRRRGDRAFYLRLAGAIRQNERAVERLKW